MPPPGGYHGRYLRVDATTGRTTCAPLAEGVLRSFIGGVGLGTWLVARETPAGCAPLAPEAALVLALSPLVGSPLTTSAKFAVVALSPLTGRLCDALASSHFAIAAKRAGIDAIVLTGASEEPSVVLIDGSGMGRDNPGPSVEFRAAGPLWGLSAAEAEQRLRSDLGKDWQIGAIGPAGERLIPFATLSHDGRHAGRGGLGAVLGSKRIKAVAVRGERRAAPNDMDRTVAISRQFSARSFGPATEKYRELGTVANLLVFNRFDALPTRNFQCGRFEGAERLAAEDLGPARRIARTSCAACTIGCEHIYALEGGPKGSGIRLEYESLFALGPLCGVDDPEAVLRAAAECDRAGLDTISTGATIAFLMDCAERGWIDGRLASSGRPLRFGDGAAVLEAIDAIVKRDGHAGELLALGSRGAAARIGGEAVGLAPHVKGLELPGYDPRALHTMALGLAVGTRGADHNRSTAYEVDFSERADRLRGGPASAPLAIETEDRAAVLDSLILCKFLRGVFDDFYAESAEMLRAVTGWDISADELRVVAKRVVNARKCLNQREGWSRAEDTLPARLLSDEHEPSTAAPALSRARLDVMIAAYYEARGWTPDGVVPHDLRRKLGLDGLEFGECAVPRSDSAR
jgi:aldehyde:ferredoxin oxidoreductase